MRQNCKVDRLFRDWNSSGIVDLNNNIIASVWLSLRLEKRVVSHSLVKGRSAYERGKTTEKSENELPATLPEAQTCPQGSFS